MLSHDRIWNAIDVLAERNGLSASGLAKRAGLDPTTFNKSKRHAADGRPRWPSTESIAKILQAVGAELRDLFGLLDADAVPQDFSRTIPLVGFGQAGSGGFFDDSGYPAGAGWDVVEFPSAPSGGVYSIEVQGDSMLPLYRAGDKLIVDPAKSARRGDRVVARLTTGEVLVKLLHKANAKEVVLRSLNPEHEDRTVAREHVEWVARIVWASQ
jgi:phage repressor protein C with HTH and peptisase S24 domain